MILRVMFHVAAPYVPDARPTPNVSCVPPTASISRFAPGAAWAPQGCVRSMVLTVIAGVDDGFVTLSTHAMIVFRGPAPGSDVGLFIYTSIRYFVVAGK